MAAAYLGSTMETQTTTLNTLAYFFCPFLSFFGRAQNAHEATKSIRCTEYHNEHDSGKQILD